MEDIGDTEGHTVTGVCNVVIGMVVIKVGIRVGNEAFGLCLVVVEMVQWAKCHCEYSGLNV